MKNYPILVLLVGMLAACEKKDPVIPNDEELITTLELKCTQSATNQTTAFIFQDLDGDGGEPPVIKTTVLKANQEYETQLDLLNETLTPVFFTNTEVEAESDEHQVFYQIVGADAHFFYEDSDDNGKPLGLKMRLKTGSASNGTLTITLRHLPDKSAVGVADGDIANAGGETDIEVTFPFQIVE